MGKISLLAIVLLTGLFFQDKGSPFGKSRKSKDPVKSTLRKLLGAKDKELKKSKDGSWSVNLDYNFAKSAGTDAFASNLITRKDEGLEFAANGMLELKSGLNGDFTARIEFSPLEPAPARGARIVIDAGGQGALMGLGDEWRILAARFGKNKGVLSDEKVAGDPGELVLQRKGTTIKVSSGEVSCGAAVPSAPAFQLRIFSLFPVRLTRLEVRGTLDPAWVKKALKPPPGPAPKGRNLYDGSSLEGWYQGADRPFRATARGIEMIGKGHKVGNLMHDDNVSGRVRLVIQVEVTGAYPSSLFGIVLLWKGKYLSDPGNIGCLFGRFYSNQDGLRIAKIQGRKWPPIEEARAETRIKPGKYWIEVVHDGSDVVMTVNGVDELRAKNLLPAGTPFRPSFIGIDVDCVITRYDVIE